MLFGVRSKKNYAIVKSEHIGKPIFCWKFKHYANLVFSWPLLGNSSWCSIFWAFCPVNGLQFSKCTYMISILLVSWQTCMYFCWLCYRYKTLINVDIIRLMFYIVNLISTTEPVYFSCHSCTSSITGIFKYA